ncbi:hypothetical protein E8E13_000786 [Curvularia kusanoi]|uniref:Uncharacterized protein n=1 Tax=Curvularia kusanoi TaxID=90978 RepID=A0A9P4W3W2_CURKU|nr:hypothetical protein E8E13_000786 [Curvularia kusanoi]
MVTSNERVRDAHHRLRYATEELGVNTEPPPAPYSAQGLGVNAGAPSRRPSAPAESCIAWQRSLQVQPPDQSDNNRLIPKDGLISPSEVNNDTFTVQPWEIDKSLSRPQRLQQHPLTPPIHNGMQLLQPQINGRRQSYPYYYPPLLQQGAANYRINGLPRDHPKFLSITRPLVEAVETDDFLKFALLGDTGGSTGEQGLGPPQHQSQQIADHPSSNNLPASQAQPPPRDPTAPRTLAGAVRPSLQNGAVPRTSSSRQPLRSSHVAPSSSQDRSQSQLSQGPAVQQWDLRDIVRSNRSASSVSQQNSHNDAKRQAREELRKNIISAVGANQGSPSTTHKGRRSRPRLLESLVQSAASGTEIPPVPTEPRRSSQQPTAIVTRVGTSQATLHQEPANPLEALLQSQPQSIEKLWGGLLRRQTIAAGMAETQTTAAKPKRPATSFTQNTSTPPKRRKIATNQIAELLRKSSIDERQADFPGAGIDDGLPNTDSNHPDPQVLRSDSTWIPVDIHHELKRISLIDSISESPHHDNDHKPSDSPLAARATVKCGTSRPDLLHAHSFGQGDTAKEPIVSINPSPDEIAQALPSKYVDWKWSVYHYKVSEIAGYAHAERWIEALFESNLVSEFNTRHFTHVSQGFIQDGDHHSILVLHNAANPFEYDPAPTSTITIGVYGYHWYEHSEIRWTTLASDQRALLTRCVGVGLIALKHKWSFDSSKAAEKRFHRAYWLAANRLKLGGLLNRRESDDKPHDLIVDKSTEDPDKDWSVHEEDLMSSWDATEEQAMAAWEEVQAEVEALGDEIDAREFGWPNVVTRHKEF